MQEQFIRSSQCRLKLCLCREASLALLHEAWQTHKALQIHVNTSIAKYCKMCCKSILYRACSTDARRCAVSRRQASTHAHTHTHTHTLAHTCSITELTVIRCSLGQFVFCGPFIRAHVYTKWRLRCREHLLWGNDNESQAALLTSPKPTSASTNSHLQRMRGDLTAAVTGP